MRVYGIPWLTKACDRCEWAALKSRNLYLYCVSGEEGSMEWFLSIMADQCPCVDTIQTLWSGDRGHYATCHRATILRFFNSDNRSIINTQRSIQRRVSILIGTLVSQKNCVWKSHIWRIFSDKTDPFQYYDFQACHICDMVSQLWRGVSQLWHTFCKNVGVGIRNHS